MSLFYPQEWRWRETFAAHETLADPVTWVTDCSVTTQKLLAAEAVPAGPFHASSSVPGLRTRLVRSKAHGDLQGRGQRKSKQARLRGPADA